MRFELLIIRAVTPGAHREFVIGTLERVAEIERASGKRAASRWLRREMWRVVFRAPRHRSVVGAMQGSEHARRGSFSLESLLYDLRSAVRTLKREPMLGVMPMLGGDFGLCI